MALSNLTTMQATALQDVSLGIGGNKDDSVATPNNQYKWMSKRWNLPQVLMGGTVAMREAGKLYLPQNPKEIDPDYKNRLARSTLTNVFKKTVVNLSSKPFTKPAMISEDMDPQIIEWISEDIDREGNDINAFSALVLEDALVNGKSHVLTEYPRIEDDRVLTLADVAQRGLRPYLTHIKAKSLIGWKSEVTDGIETLTQIRIHETARVDTGRFTEMSVNRIRVIERGSFQLWQEDHDNREWVVIDQGETALDYIPLETFYTNKEGFLVASPPLRDLADLNQSHWESTSDQNHILHVARVPVMFGKGLGGVDENGAPIQVTVSPNSLVQTDNPDADLVYVEHSGQAIGAGRQHGIDILETMEAFSLQLLVPKSGDVTATASAIDAAAAQSDLQRMVNDLEGVMEASIGHMAELAGKGEEAVGEIEYFDDFNIAVGSVEEATLLVNMALSGKLSTRTLLEEIKRRGLLSEKFDPEVEAELARNDAGTTLEGMFPPEV